MSINLALGVVDGVSGILKSKKKRRKERRRRKRAKAEAKAVARNSFNAGFNPGTESASEALGGGGTYQSKETTVSTTQPNIVLYAVVAFVVWKFFMKK